jgi:hypothetical protein
MKLRAEYIQETLFNIQFITINIMSTSHTTEEDNPVKHNGESPVLTFKTSVSYPQVCLRVSCDSQNKQTKQH